MIQFQSQEEMAAFNANATQEEVKELERKSSIKLCAQITGAIEEYEREGKKFRGLFVSVSVMYAIMLIGEGKVKTDGFTPEQCRLVIKAYEIMKENSKADLAISLTQ